MYLFDVVDSFDIVLVHAGYFVFPVLEMYQCNFISFKEAVRKSG